MEMLKVRIKLILIKLVYLRNAFLKSLQSRKAYLKPYPPFENPLNFYIKIRITKLALKVLQHLRTPTKFINKDKKNGRAEALPFSFGLT